MESEKEMLVRRERELMNQLDTVLREIQEQVRAERLLSPNDDRLTRIGEVASEMWEISRTGYKNAGVSELVERAERLNELVWDGEERASKPSLKLVRETAA